MKMGREHSAMDFFVLATISRGGLQSLYELQHGVELQPGGIHPVLKRLEEDGLLERSEQQKRRRRLMTVTNRGEQFLDEEWQDCLRAATVAILMGHRNAAHDYLMGAADHYDQYHPESLADPQRASLSPVELYSFMRREWECSRRRSAAAVLRVIAEKLMEGRRS